MGKVNAAAKRKSLETMSFPVAIKVKPEVTKIVNTISRPRFIRLIIELITLGLDNQNGLVHYCIYQVEGQFRNKVMTNVPEISRFTKENKRNECF
jgi:hypothetical protein